MPAPRQASYQQLRDFCIDEGILDSNEETAADQDGAGRPVGSPSFSDSDEPPLDDEQGGDE